MSDSSNQSEAEFRAYRLEHLRSRFRGDEIALGEELLTFLSDRTNEVTHEVRDRFLGRSVAMMGDSLGGMRFGARDGDLVCHPVYLRIVIYPGDPPQPPQCAHYLACVRGTVGAFNPAFGIVGLQVSAEDYHITERFL